MESIKPCSCEDEESCNCEDECCEQADEMNPDPEDQPCTSKGCSCNVNIDEDF
jgi:hypothetical protein